MTAHDIKTVGAGAETRLECSCGWKSPYAGMRLDYLRYCRAKHIQQVECEHCSDGWLNIPYEQGVGPILRGCPYCGAGKDEI